MIQTPEPRDSTVGSRRLVAITIAGLALRLLFVFLEPKTRPIADETMWLMALTRLPAAHFSVFANYPLFQPPLYPYFLATLNTIFGSLFAIKIAQAFIGALLIPAVARVAAGLFGSRAGTVSAIFVALYPEFIWYPAHFWCETLFLTLFWWALERIVAADQAARRKDAIVAGVLFGLAVLTRETVLYLLPFAALWLVYQRPRDHRPAAVALLLAAFVVVAPWTLRNWVQFHVFIPVSTSGGLNLYQGNAELSRGEVYDEVFANDGKIEQYKWARAEGIKAILRRQPGWIFEKIRDEGPRLFELDSLALIHIRRGAYGSATCGEYAAATAIVLLPWALIAAASALALSRLRIDRSTAFMIGLIGLYLLLHIATHGFSRYRLPVVPGFMILASTLFENDCRAGHGAPRRVLLIGLVIALGLLWAPSLADQLGDLGFLPPPTYEGFAPVCAA